MGYGLWLQIACFLLVAGYGTSSPFISNNVLEAHGTIGRSLLQALKPCNVSFQSLNYTILTSNCKGPNYPVDKCCDSFKTFACPLRDAINDLTTDCANTMFSYINLYGRYPPGLFANLCKDPKRQDGLDCSTIPTKSNANSGANVSSLLVLLLGFLVSLFQLF